MNTFDRLMSMGSEERIRVVISRNWDNPQIKVTVNKDAIILEASIDSFVKAIASELGNPFWIGTRARLRQRVAVASLAVLEKIKLASAQVM